MHGYSAGRTTVMRMRIAGLGIAGGPVSESRVVILRLGEPTRTCIGRLARGTRQGTIVLPRACT
jgi:hypothetical protein